MKFHAKITCYIAKCNRIRSPHLLVQPLLKDQVHPIAHLVPFYEEESKSTEVKDQPTLLH